MALAVRAAPVGSSRDQLMKIVLPGGSGQVGTILARAFQADGHEVVVLSRHPTPAAWRTRAWDGMTRGPWVDEIDGADVVINLAGRSVNCRYTPAHRREIMESRVRSTRLVGTAIAQVKRPPRVWLQASTATIYADRYDAPNDEFTGKLGATDDDSPDTWRFSVDVAQSWERAALEEHRAAAATRLVLMRTSMIMSPDRGGILDTLLTLVRRGLGGAVAGGRQYVSWMHEYDFVRTVRWLLEHEAIHGPVNLAAPHPLPYAEFMRALRTAAGKRFGLSSPRWMLEIGALFMRTETELVLKSRRVVPGVLLQNGFTFDFPEWPGAAHELVRRARK